MLYVEQIKAFHQKANSSRKVCEEIRELYSFRWGVSNLDISKKAIFLPTYICKNEVLTILF